MSNVNSRDSVVSHHLPRGTYPRPIGCVLPSIIRRANPSRLGLAPSVVTTSLRSPTLPCGVPNLSYTRFRASVGFQLLACGQGIEPCTRSGLESNRLPRAPHMKAHYCWEPQGRPKSLCQGQRRMWGSNPHGRNAPSRFQDGVARRLCDPPDLLRAYLSSAHSHYGC